MLRLRVAVLALVGTMVLGCGPSFRQLVQQERWDEACIEATDLEIDLADSKRHHILMQALLSEVELTVEGKVFTVAELEEALPYVPARLRDGSTVLVYQRFEATRMPGEVTVANLIPFGDEKLAPDRECCGPVAWLRLDGRESEADQLEKAIAEREARSEELRKRYAGPWGALLAIGEGLAGLSADLAYLTTLGAIDIDRSSLPGAQVTPLQLMRAVGKQITEATQRSDPTPTDDEKALARRKAEAAAILQKLVVRPSFAPCGVYVDEPCEHFDLHDVEPGPKRFIGAFDVDVGTCEVEAHLDLPDAPTYAEAIAPVVKPTSFAPLFQSHGRTPE